MRRTDRLFEILQLFRSGRLLLGRDIADKLEVSIRTVYRDIDTLVASGIQIEGERGVGYILREPIFLPPLALTRIELQALALGVAMVEQVSDAELAEAATRLRSKIETVSPSDRTRTDPLREMSVYASEVTAPAKHLQGVRQAVADREILEIGYQTVEGRKSVRRIWPLQTEYWGRAWTCPAWCELRDDFRVFRIDRIETLKRTGRHFEPSSGRAYQDYLAQVPVEKWQAAQNKRDGSK